MSLRHWEATRDAIRESLEDCDDIATNELKDALASSLANVAIEAYTKSICKGYIQEPRIGDGVTGIFTGSYSR